MGLELLGYNYWVMVNVRVMARVRVRVFPKQGTLEFEFGLNWPEVCTYIRIFFRFTFVEKYIRK